jgi:hypothetical protein
LGHLSAGYLMVACMLTGAGIYSSGMGVASGRKADLRCRGFRQYGVELHVLSSSRERDRIDPYAVQLEAVYFARRAVAGINAWYYPWTSLSVCNLYNLYVRRVYNFPIRIPRDESAF